MDSKLVQVLARNVDALRAHKPELRAQSALAKKAGVNQKTVSRMLNETNAVGIDTLESVAAALKVEAWQLLVPGISPERLPTLVTHDLFSAQFSDAGRELAQRFDKLTNDAGKQRLFLDLIEMIDAAASRRPPGADGTQPDAAPTATPARGRRTPRDEAPALQPEGNTEPRR